MTELICLIVTTIIGIIIFDAARSSLTDWYNKMHSWQSPPSFHAIMDSLLDGILGGTGMVIAAFILIANIISTIHLLT